MKKKHESDGHDLISLSVFKILRVMKLMMVLICFIGLLSSFGKSYSQNTKLSVEFKNSSIESVLNYIESRTEYSFMYDNKKIDISREVNISAKDQTVEAILDQLFENEVYYKMIGKHIIITPKEEQLSVASEQQQKSISGKIIDSTGAPLPGVSVVVKGTTTGVITDMDGKYTLLKVPENATLQFSFVGMKSQEIKVIGKTKIDITLVEETVGIEEVVAVGYGTQKKVNLTGSVSTVSSEKLTVAPVANVTNSLAGRLTGLVTKQESGKPGSDDATLSIRGFGSPLVIVDGIEASFNTLDANEIESVSILKDASAAIYGSRAGNGVLLVTTKRGNSGKPKIEFSSNWTFQGVTSMPRMTSSGQRAELIREGWLNSGKPESTCRFTQEDVDLFYAGTNPDYPNTNWDKIVLNDWAPQQQNNLSVRGGSDKIKYYGFLGYMNQKSMFKNNGGEYNRYNLQSNIDAKITDNLSIQLDLSGIIEKKLFPWRDENTDIWQDYWTTEPFWSPTLPNGNLAYGGAGTAIGIHYMSNMDLMGYNKFDISNLKGTLSLKYNFSQIKGLSAKAFANYYQKYTFQKYFNHFADSWSYNHSNDSYTQWSSATPATLIHQIYRDQVLTGQFSLNYDNTIANKHHITGLALYEVIN